MKFRQKIFFSVLLWGITCASAQKTPMRSFVDNLQAKMTLDEKIGQLNQEAVSDGVLTGSIVQGGV